MLSGCGWRPSAEQACRAPPPHRRRGGPTSSSVREQEGHSGKTEADDGALRDLGVFTAKADVRFSRPVLEHIR